jgi:hypothetical protein
MAVLRLIRNWNFVGCSTGSSLGLVPAPSVGRGRRYVSLLPSYVRYHTHAIRRHSASALPHPSRTVNTLGYTWAVAGEQSFPPL